MTLTPMRPTPLATRWERWDPFREMEEMFNRMSMLMQSYLPTPMTTFADVEETDDRFIVEVDVPGARPEDINLELRDGELRVTGEIKERERKGLVRHKARRFGEFEHVVDLPGPVDPNRVEAKLHEGVLTVEVAKAEATQARRIEVKAAS